MDPTQETCLRKYGSSSFECFCCCSTLHIRNEHKHKGAPGRCDCCRLTVRRYGAESTACRFLLRLSEDIFVCFILKCIERKAGFAAGNSVQALLFGLIHGIPFGLATKSIPALVFLILLPGLFGWYQGWLNEKKCGGSIVPGWLLHGCINFVTAALSLH